MQMQVGNPVGRLAGQTIDVPELRRIRVPVQDVVHAQARAPVPGECVLHVRVPFTIATALYLIVRGQRLAAEIAIFQAAAPGTEIFYIDIERAGGKRGIGKIAPDVAGAIVEVRGEARMVARIAGVELEPLQGLIGQIDLVSAAAASGACTILARIRVVGGF